MSITSSKRCVRWQLALALLLASLSLWLLSGCASIDAAKMMTALAGDTNAVHLRVQTGMGSAELWRNLPEQAR